VHRPTQAAPSPERVLQRPVPVGATAHPHRSPGLAVQPLQSTLGGPLGSTAPLVGQGRPANAASEPTRRREGRIVMIEIFLGASVQKGIFTSVCNLLKLVKFLEICRKLRKFEINFVGTVVKSTTTFVILTWSDSGHF
jgi:hypothetical protein